jgi:5'(3')-deoxyribonucleotidase
MRIGIDIDDVLYPWYATAHAICERAGITNGVTPTSWRAYEEYGCTDQVWFDVLAEATVSGELYGAAPFDGVVEHLERLRAAGHTIHLVTARGFMQHGSLIRMLTVDWTEEHGIPHDSLTFVKDKRLVDVDLFLDDGPHNYDQLDAADVAVYLFVAPHNVADRETRRTIGDLASFVAFALAYGDYRAASALRRASLINHPDAVAHVLASRGEQEVSR